MAWYGRRRTGETRPGTTAVLFGLSLAMLGVLAVQTSTAVRNGLDTSRETMDATTASLASLSTGATSWQIGFGGDKELRAELEALREENLRLRQYRELSETMSLRMARYEELLNLVGVTRAPELMARVVSELRGPFSNSVISNAGSAEGVREGFSAVNENGLVGRVVRVGAHTSRVLLIEDFNSRIPVKGRQSGDRALLMGDGNGQARLIEPETPDQIVPGELWVTSGDDGQIPEDIPVGRAVRKGDKWFVDLFVNRGAVDYVRLLPPPDFATPEAAPASETVSASGTASANPTSSLVSVTDDGGEEGGTQ